MYPLISEHLPGQAVDLPGLVGGGGLQVVQLQQLYRTLHQLHACMSGMSAACGTTFGGVLDNDVARACLSYLGREVKQCCEAAGYQLPILLHEQSPETLDIADQAMFNADQEMFLTMYSDMRTAKASMLQDLEKGKPTEVRMINGYVCETGDKYGIDTPFNDKVVEIVTKIERGEQPLSMDNVKLFDRSLFTYDLYKA